MQKVRTLPFFKENDWYAMGNWCATALDALDIRDVSRLVHTYLQFFTSNELRTISRYLPRYKSTY